MSIRVMSRAQRNLLLDLTEIAGGDGQLVEDAIRSHGEIREVVRHILTVRAGRPPPAPTRGRAQREWRDQWAAYRALPWWRRLTTRTPDVPDERGAA